MSLSTRRHSVGVDVGGVLVGGGAPVVVPAATAMAAAATTMTAVVRCDAFTRDAFAAAAIAP